MNSFNMKSNLSELSSNLFCAFVEASEIWLDLRIVYDKSHFTKNSAMQFLKTQIQDLADVFNEIKIGFEIEYVAGTATEKAANGLYWKIAEGAKDDIINAYLFFDKNATYDHSWFHSGSSQIFLRKSGFTETTTLRAGALSHEMGHLFGVVGKTVTAAAVKIMGSSGDNWLTNGIDNVIPDAIIENANALCRKGNTLYGRDWGDVNRLQKITSVSDRRYGATDNELQSVYPTTLDVYRAGAEKIAAQTK